MHPALFAILFAVAASAEVIAQFKIGAARVDVTPDYPIRLSGYAARTNESQGVGLRIFAKALAVQEGSKPPALLITLDNCAISAALRAQTLRGLQHRHKLRDDHFALTVTHTHSAPVLTDVIANIFVGPLNAEEQGTVDRYTRELVVKLQEVGHRALSEMEPGKLYWALGEAKFAGNRRTPSGPVDHALPTLAARAANGDLKAVWANYACHCTTLQGNLNQIHGDWAGVAASRIEQTHDGAVALISIGCGADSNPSPRGAIEHVNQHGASLATEVERTLSGWMTELRGPLKTRAKQIALPHAPLPSRAEWEKRSKEAGIVGYHAKKNLDRLSRGQALPTELPYMIQTWTFGDQLGLVFLPGEVVVDYALRLKRELDGSRLWVNAYANDVPCYIPSKRILAEGGYEAETSLWYYDRPARLAPETEDLIVGTVTELIPPGFRARSGR